MHACGAHGGEEEGDQRTSPHKLISTGKNRLRLNKSLTYVWNDRGSNRPHTVFFHGFVSVSPQRSNGIRATSKGSRVAFAD